MVLRGNKLRVEDVEAPEPGPMQVLAKVLACGICGSDLHAAKHMDDMIAASRRSGIVPWETEGQGEGIVMGHEFVAEVVKAGPDTDTFTPGTRVTSVPVLIDPSSPNGMVAIGYSTKNPGAYGEYIVLSAPLVLRVPDGLPNRVAATTEPCGVGLHAVREAKLQSGEHALVMGAGPIGLMTLLWLKKEGTQHVTLSDFSPTRRALAEQLGADLVLDPSEANVLEAVTQAAGSPPPVVFECVGVEGTLQQAMELVRRGGRVVVVGVCVREDRIFPMVGINKQLTLQFVLGYTPAEYAEALAALADGSINAAPMVTGTVTLDKLPATFEALADPTDCKVVLEF